jgi:hypothetical protein
MNDALLPWFLVILVGIALILLLSGGRSRRDGNGAGTGSWSAGSDGDSGGGDGGDGGSD